MTTNTYGDLCPGSKCVGRVLRNLSAQEVWIPSKTAIGKVQTTKKVPDWEVLSHTGENPPPKQQKEPPKVSWTSSPELPEKKVTKPTPRSSWLESEFPTLEPNVLGKVNLLGYGEWDPEDQLEAQSILREYANIFAKDDLDLGWTSIMKHKITLEEEAKPVKEWYRRVPPGLCDEAQKHLQEMINVRALRPSSSPLASSVVLVRKKKSKLCFCINLQKLNSLTVKDVCSIPRIQDSLNCLQGAVWFILLDLKSGNWQVELKEACKPLTTFTVGSLGFYECKWMSCGLTNDLVVFQYLMETCLGDLQFWWCIIYLDDIIAFVGTPVEHLKRPHTVLSWLWEPGLFYKIL